VPDPRVAACLVACLAIFACRGGDSGPVSESEMCQSLRAELLDALPCGEAVGTGTLRECSGPDREYAILLRCLKDYGRCVKLDPEEVPEDIRSTITADQLWTIEARRCGTPKDYNPPHAGR